VAASSAGGKLADLRLPKDYVRTGDGMRAPTPQLQFGSVRSSDKTPAQQRLAGEPWPALC